MKRQLTFTFDYGVTPEQACIMCHLSSKCSGCCVRCDKGCEGQICSQESRNEDGQRWEAWIYNIKECMPELRKFIPKKYLK